MSISDSVSLGSFNESCRRAFGHIFFQKFVNFIDMTHVFASLRLTGPILELTLSWIVLVFTTDGSLNLVDSLTVDRSTTCHLIVSEIFNGIARNCRGLLAFSFPI